MNRLRQSFHARATLRTLNKLGNPLALRTSPLSTLQERIWEHYTGLNLTLFTFSARGSTMVFIVGVRKCCGRRLGAWGPLVRPAGQVSSLHCLWALDTLSTFSYGHVDKTIFGNAPTHGRQAKVMWPADHTLERLSPCFVPGHPLMPYCL
jgi:hypothetical protein